MHEKFEVKSSVHDYSVEFVDDFSAVLKAELTDGDALLIDRKIFELYGAKLEPLLVGRTHRMIDATEEQKSYLGVVPVIERLIASGFRKQNRLIAIGGGITQDTTAFIASILYRGVGWLFFPTTLLAQGDSCIGSKTAINFGQYKNQIGGFYPPLRVFIDFAFLDTLDEKDMKSGLGEMLHYYIISGREDYGRFVRDYDCALEDRETLRGVVARSLAIKKQFIERDEFDKKERQVLNYGHSFGHALECVTGYRIPHGIAVVYGMDIANFVSMKLGLLAARDYQEMHSFFTTVRAGFELGEIALANYLAALMRDKKNTRSELGLILTRGPGQTFKTLLAPDERFREWIVEYVRRV